MNCRLPQGSFHIIAEITDSCNASGPTFSALFQNFSLSWNFLKFSPFSSYAINSHGVSRIKVCPLIWHFACFAFSWTSHFSLRTKKPDGTWSVRLVKYMCSKEQRSTAIAQAVGHHLRKEVILMPITLTFHVFGLTITVTVKSNNRHSAKWRLFIK